MSVILAARASDREDADLAACLSTVSRAALVPSRVEVLIKLDDDDPGLPDLLDAVKADYNGMRVVPMVTPRAAGYYDLHKAYNDLFLRIDADSQAVIGISDDARFLVRGYDQVVEKVSKERDIWIMQDPGYFDEFMTIPYAMLTNWADPYTMWSRALLECTNGFPLLPSADAWSGMLARLLIDRYGVDMRLAWSERVLRRLTHKGDFLTKPDDEMSEAERERARKRQEQIELMRQEPFQRLLRWQAHNVYMALKSRLGDPSDPDFKLPKDDSGSI